MTGREKRVYARRENEQDEEDNIRWETVEGGRKKIQNITADAGTSAGTGGRKDDGPADIGYG